jgi:Mg-chelatase subunit ChlD
VRALEPTDDPIAAIGELAGCTAPWLFGVRHHSPACATALLPLLDRLAPAAVAVELPADLAPWVPWLAHPEAEAPLAIAAVSSRGDDLGFYPFADFSPELVAIRWARGRGVPVHAIDLPAARKLGHAREPAGMLGIAERLRGPDDDSWEHLVEGPAALADPERVRRAALLYGWALRLDAARGDGVGALDRAREAYMRDALARIAQRGGRVAAIVGAFHAAALLPEPRLWHAAPVAEGAAAELVSSLIPYGFELLDERSGYPAGIRDPMWQQRLWQTLRDGGDVGALVAACLVEITRAIRARGLPASVPDANAAADVALSLARLRGLAAPGRRELVEAVQTALTQGELLGRGRVVARAMEHVLVGRRRGRLADGTPRSGLGPHVGALLTELRLPAAQMVEPEDIRLDPLRSRLDRRRHVALCRLRACGVPYASELPSVAAGGVETLTVVWRIRMTPATEAMIELAGLRGVTLRQAAAGALRAERARLVAEDRLGPAVLIALTEAAANAGAGELAGEWLAELAGPRLADATLAELIALVALIDRVLAGHVVGLPSAEDAVPGEIDAFATPAIDRPAVLGAAVASVLGLAGSESLADARALAELVRVLDRPEHAALGDGRLRWSIDELVRTGTPVIGGAAAVVQVLIGSQAADALATAIGGWLDAAVDGDGRARLAGRLRGALTVAGPLFEAAPVFLDELFARVEQLTDADFLARVAALRDGFEVLSAASRRRLLRVLGDRLGETDARGHGLDVTTAIAPERMVAAAEADRAGRDAMARIPRPACTSAVDATRVGARRAAEAARVPNPGEVTTPAGEVATTGGPDEAATAAPVTGPSRRTAASEHQISVRDRWRLVLGQERAQMKPRAASAARALDELYGHGHGEGSREELGAGGGQDGAYPTVRAWRDDIEALFGARVFEEVAARAAAAGRVGALLELDPGQVTPSVELLEQVLSLKGGLGEAQLDKLRALIRRVVDELVRELAIRVRPALHGALSPRATRRPTTALHLPRTIAANLARARIDGDEVTLIPDRLYFKQKSRRHLDWNIVLVVDVSGSMEPSVIYSAMMAAILSAVPWITVRFLAFATEVIDLSAHVSDPLALLLEVSVGGGTHIAKALRYARELAAVPRRTLVVVVSDFEEGYAVEALLGEVRALVESGVTCLGLAALDDRGAPRYQVQIAEQVAGAGMPIAALTPLELARWVGDQIR